MEFIRGLHNLTGQHSGCVASIGNFDAVHRGHQALLDRLKQIATALKLPSTVIIFEPQPKEYFAKHQGETLPLRLQTLSEKLRTFTTLAVDRVLCIAFSDNFRRYSKEAFVEELLIKRLGVAHLIVGDDFRYGHDRKGDFSHLQQAAEHYHFGLESTPTLYWHQQRISSSAIREALSQGELSKANALIGRPFSLSGRVIKGQQLGRTLGFPTANILHKRQQLPMTGVFLVEVEPINPICDLYQRLPKRLSGVANLGYKPSILGSVQPSLEVHLLLPDNQPINCYNHRFEVHFLQKLRDEQKFDSLEQLQCQVHADILAARKLFHQTQPFYQSQQQKQQSEQSQPQKQPQQQIEQHQQTQNEHQPLCSSVNNPLTKPH